ncbi:MAG: thermonuclease family protein [Chloroflexi bacterium]|nr:thermonuclease family protein [Chloroflexota bacterium]
MRLLALSLFFALTACAGVNKTNISCEDCFEVQVIRVIDGGTLDTSRGVVRLYGVDTPEGGQPCASESTKRLRELAGDTIRLEVGTRTIDQYGRMLAYVYSQDGISIDEVLIREGMTEAWTRDGQHRDYLVGLEQDAKRQEAGCLW